LPSQIDSNDFPTAAVTGAVVPMPPEVRAFPQYLRDRFGADSVFERYPLCFLQAEVAFGL
jgi:hypothetical protein